MSREQAARRMRTAGCAALVALLAACSYWGAKQPPASAVSVPVAVETISESALGASSLEETQDRLRQEREQALALVQSVIDDPSAGAGARDEALKEKTALAKRMEQEAALTALLAHMGFGDAAVVLGEDSAAVIIPWQAAENERSRVQIIDAAATQTGLAPECVKIILSKK
ncbi:MAG: SpoIIIAH-like family protein [Candidatus Ventricola sp.]